MSKSFGSSKSNSLKKTKVNNNEVNLSSTQKVNQSRFSGTSESKHYNKSLSKSNDDFKIEFLAKNKKESSDDYIKNNVEESLRCKVCKSLFNEPVCCYKCLSIYCFACIKRETNNHCRCPCCFNIVFSDLMIYVEANYKENYKKYNVKCPHEGCKESLNLYEIKQHISTCLFRLVNNPDKIQKISSFNAPKDKDFYLRPHLLKYTMRCYDIISSNKSRDIKEIEFSNCGMTNASTNSSINDIKFSNKIPSLASQMTNLTDYLIKTVNELAIKTKKTNDKVKKKFNKTNLNI